MLLRRLLNAAWRTDEVFGVTNQCARMLRKADFVVWSGVMLRHLRFSSMAELVRRP
jgi:hypothetical protein